MLPFLLLAGSVIGADPSPLDQLQTIPEVILLRDHEVEDLHEKAQKTFPIRQRDRNARDALFGLLQHRALVAAAQREGLPLSTRQSLRDIGSARVMDELSREMRHLGFTSVPLALLPTKDRKNPPRLASPLAEKRAALFDQWCTAAHLEKYRGAPATLLQMLQIEEMPLRLALVKRLAQAKSTAAVPMLVNRAVMDLAPEVRQAATKALRTHPAKTYLPDLLKALRYPWPPVAENAAESLIQLSPPEAVKPLRAFLERSDSQPNRPVIRELVRINHLRNCLLCHAPSVGESDGLVRASVPKRNVSLTSYYGGTSGAFIRADTTFLRQDFSVILKVKDKPWPEEQRFDFVVRTRPAAKGEEETGNEPQRQAALRVLQALTQKEQ